MVSHHRSRSHLDYGLSWDLEGGTDNKRVIECIEGFKYHRGHCDHWMDISLRPSPPSSQYRRWQEPRIWPLSQKLLSPAPDHSRVENIMSGLRSIQRGIEKHHQRNLRRFESDCAIRGRSRMCGKSASQSLPLTQGALCDCSPKSWWFSFSLQQAGDAHFKMWIAAT